MSERTTISLDDKVSKLSTAYCSKEGLKFSNLVQGLLIEKLKQEGLLPSEECEQSDWEKFQALKNSGFDFENAFEELAGERGLEAVK